MVKFILSGSGNHFNSVLSSHVAYVTYQVETSSRVIPSNFHSIFSF